MTLPGAGIGSTSAGLTVAAVKEKDNWVLEAGSYKHPSLVEASYNIIY